MEGKSVPSNSIEVFGDAYNWITKYIENPRPITNLRLNFNYFNTSSLIWISKMIRALSSIRFPDYSLYIHLYLSDEDVEDLDPDDVIDILTPVVDINSVSSVNLCIKIYGIDENGKIIKETNVLI